MRRSSGGPQRGDPVAWTWLAAAEGPHRRAGVALPRQVPAPAACLPRSCPRFSSPATGCRSYCGASRTIWRPPEAAWTRVRNWTVWYVRWRASCPRSSRRSFWPSARSSASGLAIVAQVDRLLVSWLGEQPGASLQLLRGIPGNVTTEMDLKLWEVARAIGADPASRAGLPGVEPCRGRRGLPARAACLPSPRQAVAGFLPEYGMRGPGEVDLGRPRWDDDPGAILQTIAGYLDLKDPAQAPDAVFARGARQSAELLAEYQARLRRTRFGFIKAHLLGEAVRRMRLLTADPRIPQVRHHPLPLPVPQGAAAPRRVAGGPRPAGPGGRHLLPDAGAGEAVGGRRRARSWPRWRPRCGRPRGRAAPTTSRKRPGRAHRASC